MFHFLQALVIDGKLQSAETDEFIYHECLVHPALLHHPKYFFFFFCHLHTLFIFMIFFFIFINNILIFFSLNIYYSPKTIFIMGGGEGSTARELLRHKAVDKVVMCDIDEVKPLSLQFFFSFFISYYK